MDLLPRPRVGGGGSLLLEKKQEKSFEPTLQFLF